MNASMTLSGQLGDRSAFDDYKQANKIKSARFLYDRDERGSYSPVRPFGLGAFLPGESGTFATATLPLERSCKIAKKENQHCEFKYNGRIEKRRFAGLPFYCGFNAVESFDQDGQLIESTVEYSSAAPPQFFRLADNSVHRIEAQKRVRTVLEPNKKLLVTVVDDYAAVFVSDENGYVIADSVSLKGSCKLMSLYPDLHHACLARHAHKVS
ncbi:MAG: hypothetical protein KGS72_24640 [Cyanobacteria bacterium REEB67]|nr:hypothetical protein [Cyanobacteria bacterium REEB67]